MKENNTSALVDNILRIIAVGGTVSVVLVAPNLLIALDKPLQKYLNRLDERAQRREMSRVVSYMKSQKLITNTYEHGLKISKKGLVRLKVNEFNNLQIKKPAEWDKRWRLVFFDIPEKKKSGRDSLTRKLKRTGFIQLQRSVWIHPFPCREIIEQITTTYDVSSFVSYVEITYIENENRLKTMFGI